MKKTISHFLLALLGLGLFHGASAAAEEWPSKPVRIVIAFPPGSASDSLARVIAEEYHKELGQPFIVEHRPGASGTIAAREVARAKPDGHSLLLTSANLTGQNAAFFKELSYDPVKDFTSVGRIAMFPFMLVVNSGLPVNNVAELIAYAKQHPSLSYAYGNGTGQVAGAAFNNLLGLDTVAIGYKGTAQALTELAGGQTSFMFADVSASRPFLESGRIRPIAVSGESRSELAPTLPTVAQEANLPGFDLGSWLGLTAPAGTPPEIVKRLSDTLDGIMKNEAIQERIKSIGGEPAPLPHAEFDQYIQQQMKIWAQKVKEAGIPPQ